MSRHTDKQFSLLLEDSFFEEWWPANLQLRCAIQQETMDNVQDAHHPCFWHGSMCSVSPISISRGFCEVQTGTFSSSLQFLVWTLTCTRTAMRVLIAGWEIMSKLDLITSRHTFPNGEDVIHMLCKSNPLHVTLVDSWQTAGKWNLMLLFGNTHALHTHQFLHNSGMGSSHVQNCFVTAYKTDKVMMHFWEHTDKEIALR